jgi:hypothetical protein
MENLSNLFLAANNGDLNADEKILMKFQTLLIKRSLIKGQFDEDCCQECVVAVLSSISKFKIRK